MKLNPGFMPSDQ